jgi:hypothetical protein
MSKWIRQAPVSSQFFFTGRASASPLFISGAVAFRLLLGAQYLKTGLVARNDR